MRVVDPYADTYNPDHDWRQTRKRGKKKSKNVRRTDYFLKVRFKVPMELPDDIPHWERHKHYVDDWAPNLKGSEGIEDEVEVTVLGWREHYHEDAEQPAYRVCVWGGDDLGYERDYHFTETEPLWLVLMVLNDFPEPLTKEWLCDVVGMSPA
jgi:hypothetical protein